MKTRLFLLLFSVLLFSTTFAQDDVDLVIASGLSHATTSGFSKDNRFLATGILNQISIWDVKTGRQVRNVYFSQDATKSVDSVWFDEAGKTVIIGMMATTDRYHVDVATGTATFVKADKPMDWANYKYVQSNQMKGAIHLGNSDMKDLVFPSPDEKKQVIFKKVKNPYAAEGLMPFAFQVKLKLKGKTSEPLDTANAVAIAYSEDSRFVFANTSIYDLKTGRKVSELRIVPLIGYGIGFLPGTHIPITAAIDNVRIWDFPNVSDISVPGLSDFRPSPGFTHLVCEKYNQKTKVKDHWTIDLKTKELINTQNGTSALGQLSDVSVDAKHYAYSEMRKPDVNQPNVEFTSYLMDNRSGKKLNTLKGSYKAYFTPDQSVVLRDSGASKLFRLDLKTQTQRRFPTEKTELWTIVYRTSNDQQFILGTTSEVKPMSDQAVDYQQRVNAWNTATGEVVFEKKVKGSFVNAIEVSKDHQKIAFSSSFGHKIFICDFTSGDILYELTGHTGYVLNLAFSDDGKRLISASMDGTRKVWNLETGKEMVSLISTGPNDYAIVSPDQYYYATKGAQQSIHFVKGLSIFPFAQFDLIYNRPDIILERLLTSHTEMIRPYRLAYQKRLSRLGFTEDMLNGDFHLPVVELTNEASLPVTAENREISLAVRAKDAKFPLDRLLVRVNGVPIGGKQGQSIRGKSVQTYEAEVPVTLSTGRNLISVSVFNTKGVESIASNVIIDYLPKTAKKPDLHLFTVGVSKHEVATFDLKYASKDARDLASLFKASQSVFDHVYLHPLTDAEVSPVAVKALHTQLEKSSVDDVVCVFFAGHGLLDADLNYFLAAHQVDFESPANGGIPYETFEDLLDNIPARKKLLLLDACHSGEIDKEEVALVNNTEITEGAITFRAVNSTGLKQVGLNNSFELMKELFSDIRKSSGSMIISSAGGTEFAMEGDDWNNGVFTYCLINGLKNGKADLNGDGQIMISEVSRYVRETVAELTDGRQKPTNRAEVSEVDWRLW